jgi:predicted Zn-dependent peptidase
MSVAIERETLENGLTVIFEQNPDARSSAVGYFVRTGARDETVEESGVSHFLEHMVFKGTPRRNGMEITFSFGNMGAQANAYTSEEATVFYASIIPEETSSLLELLTDMINPSLVQEEFDVEKKVILEEIALYKDRPHFFLFENALEHYYGDHSAGNSVLGTVQSITDLSRDQMAAYHARRYVPSNIGLVVSGAFDKETIKKEVQTLTAHWKKGENTRTVLPFQPVVKSKTYERPGLNQLHLLRIAEGAAAQDDERIALSILSLMVGDTSGSKLYWELVHTGLAESAFAENDERDGTGCFFIYASCKPENEEIVRQKLSQCIAGMSDFTEAELERAKTKLCSRIVLRGETPMSRLMALGSGWLARGETVSLDELIERVRRIDAPQISSLFSRYNLKDWSEYRLVPAG